MPGTASDIYAYEAKDEYKRRARPFTSFRGERRGEPTWLLYHSSVGSPVADFVAGRAEPLIVDYHNITPAPFFVRWEPLVVGAAARSGRRQLADARSRGRARPRRLVVQRRRADATSGTGARRSSRSCSTCATLDRPGRRRARRAAARGTHAAAAVDWLFVGRIAPNKAQHDIVKAFAAYRRVPRSADARLHLVGGSSSHGYETALARVHRARSASIGAVDITGAVSDAELWRLLRRLPTCSSCAASTRASACRCSRRCTTASRSSRTRRRAIPETLGDAGLLLESKEPLVVAAAVGRVLADADLRKQMIEAGPGPARRLRPRSFASQVARRRLDGGRNGVSAIPSVHQFVPNLEPGAVGAHTRLVRDALRRGRPRVGDLHRGDPRRV